MPPSGLPHQHDRAIVYPDPVCMEEHFSTSTDYLYSLIISPVWEMFIQTTTNIDSGIANIIDRNFINYIQNSG